MCWIKSKALSLSLVLLLFLPSLLFSEASPSESCEPLLSECASLLETTTDELEKQLQLNKSWESLVNDQMIFQQTLMQQISERDTSLRETETSFNEYVKESERAQWMSNLQWAGGSFLGGALTTFIIVFLVGG